MSSTSCSSLIMSEDDLNPDVCLADQECAAFMNCNIMAQFEPCLQGRCAQAEIVAAMSGQIDDVSVECLQCISEAAAGGDAQGR